MKFIHCADLHLDSKMSANLDKDKAKERKAEILHTFERMVQYAVQNEVSAILIAGDMFDTKNISANTRNTVLTNIRNHSELLFFYLKGNHDNDNFLSDLDEIPENLKMFDLTWKSYQMGNVVVSAIELTAENTDFAHASLVLDANRFNIVMLHGQEGDLIHIRSLKNKGIDYLALGHIHAYKKEKLDARGTYCYAGCLEGRGFDECGKHGFVLLDVNETTGEYTQEYIPFASRNIYSISVDVTDCQTTSDIIEKITDVLNEEQCESSALVKIVLTGTQDVECEKDVDYVLTMLKSRFYFAKLYDETTLKINVEDYMLDQSLKGEFVRKIMQDNLISEEDKAIMIRYGLQAIAGEEVQ